jgi:TolA-binding protein
MRCGKVEKYLYQLSDGPADKKVDGHIREHLRTCSRCRQIDLSLKKTDESLSEIPEFERISESEIAEIVSENIRYNKILSSKPQKIKSLFSVPKIAVAGFSAIIVVTGALFIKPFTYKESYKLNYKNTAVYVRKDQVIKTVSGDSVLSFGQNCSMLLKKNSRCTIIRSEERTVIVELEQGKVFVAAAKGLYDTIAVCCSGFKVYATGTHFEVDRLEDKIKVSVLEGKVKTVYSKADEIDVSALETLTFKGEDSSVVKGHISSDDQEEMISNFEVTAAANTRLGLRKAISEKRNENPGRNLFYGDVKLPNRKREPDSAASRQLAIAESMMKKGRFGSAAPVLEYYLKIYNYNTDSVWFNLGACYSYTRRYNEAADAYKRVINESVDELLVETALHRRNKILFLKLKMNDDARCGGLTYLKTYPQGKWREEELFNLCRITIAENDIKEADSLTDQFLKEYPRNCHAYELLEKLRTKPKRNP